MYEGLKIEKMYTLSETIAAVLFLKEKTAYEIGQ